MYQIFHIAISPLFFRLTPIQNLDSGCLRTLGRRCVTKGIHVRSPEFPPIWIPFIKDPPQFQLAFWQSRPRGRKNTRIVKGSSRACQYFFSGRHCTLKRLWISSTHDMVTRVIQFRLIPRNGYIRLKGSLVVALHHRLSKIDPQSSASGILDSFV